MHSNHYVLYKFTWFCTICNTFAQLHSMLYNCEPFGCYHLLFYYVVVVLAISVDEAALWPHVITILT